MKKVGEYFHKPGSIFRWHSLSYFVVLSEPLLMNKSEYFQYFQVVMWNGGNVGLLEMKSIGGPFDEEL